MRLHSKLIVVGAGVATALLGLGANGVGAAEPTCASTLGIAVHGQHIVGDYVTGIGRANIDWPPKGGVVGDAVAGQGAVIPGGPGPGFHFIEGFAPGASFCNDSNSPGLHP
jgi:hypothetical protein